MANKNAYNINLWSFSNRLKQFYTHWNENISDIWGSADAIAIATAPPSEDIRYLKSLALSVWLLSYEFPDTIIIFLKKQIHLFCSQKKASLLETLKKSAKEAVDADVVIHVKARNDDGSALMNELLSIIRSQSKSDNPVVGYLAKEAPEGKFLETWSAKLTHSNLKLADVTNGVSELFAVKDATEIMCVRKAAHLTSSVFKKFVVPQLERIIDEEEKVTHSSLMDATDKVIAEPSKVKVKLIADNVEKCYPSIFQSGGKFELKPGALSNDDNLYYDSASVIISAIGSRYASYCSNIARTVLIDATTAQKKAYEVLLKAQDAAISMLKPGNMASCSYEAAVSCVEEAAPELLPNLTKSAGTGIGLEFHESGLNLNSNSDRVLKAGMVFNVSLGFHNLQAETGNPRTEKFSLWLADMVIITSERPDVLTAVCSKLVDEISYSFSEYQAVEERPKRSAAANSAMSKATLRSEINEASKEQRKQHQAELACQKNEETARRLVGSGSESSDRCGPMKASGEINSYKNENDMPPSKELIIQLDQKNVSILVPIDGSMVPFHVSTVKSVNSHQDHRTCTIHITFNVGTAFNTKDSNSIKSQDAIYLKEITFRSKDPRHCNEMVRQIKLLSKQVASIESERAQRATLVTQEKLQLSGNRVQSQRLPDLCIRPAFGGRTKKIRGTLEVHVNGFRYATANPNQRVDIMFCNIKHAFFQPAEKEMITLVHFHLHNHVMVGNTKTLDVQFYVEVMDAVQTLGGRRSNYDPDEIEEEQRERERRNKINMDFKSFVKTVHRLWNQPQFKDLDLEFDQPLRELGFHGVPHKSSVFMVPTSGCIVELIETPFVVIALSEIEVVNLERIGLGQKNFDMAIVFKDLTKDVFRIDSIPATSLDTIKEWLSVTDLKYYESRLNLRWKPILKKIIEDPKKFLEDGGWEILNLEASDLESDTSEESDQEYHPSDMEVQSYSDDDDDSDGESLVSSDKDGEYLEEDSEEGGKTWEDLEREATNADKEMGDGSDSEEDRKRKKEKAFVKSGTKGMPAKRLKV